MTPRPPDPDDARRDRNRAARRRRFAVVRAVLLAGGVGLVLHAVARPQVEAVLAVVGTFATTLLLWGHHALFFRREPRRDRRPTPDAP